MSAIFFTAFVMALSGAMMPGPLLTYTIRQSLNAGPYSGFIIIAGHALLEILLIALIFLGFDIILQSNAAQIGIGIIGGLLLIYMGSQMIISSWKKKVQIVLDQNQVSSRNMFFSGIVLSTTNPYFHLWWVIIGLGFLIQAYQSFGTTGVMMFYIGHILADFLWYGFISIVIGTTRKFINDKLYRLVIVLLGCLLIFYGGSFIYKAILLLI
jgi:threonine/homoserine/homoserine lactone efflux protein